MSHETSRRRFLHILETTFGPLLPTVIFFVASLLLLSLCRLALVAWQWDRVTAIDGAGRVFLNGLRMDLQMVGFVTLPLLLGALFFASADRPRLWARVQTGWAMLWSGVFIYMECATPSFINYYDIRPNRFFIEYLGNPREVGLTLWADYKLQIMAALVVVSLGVLAMRKIVRSGLSTGTAWGWRRRLLVIPLAIVVVALFARGSLDHRPANPGTAAFSSDHLVNDLAVNSTYSVLYALYSLRHEEDAGSIYPSMPEEEIYQRMHRMMALADRDVSSTDSPTMHLQHPMAAADRPMNLVIILEESLGAQYVASLGGKPYTPELERLSRDGIWFDQLYATGTRSVRGIEAVVTGFFPTPGRSVVKLGLSQNGFFTLADPFRLQGYDTAFIYGGESQFDNMRGFFLNNGFDRVIDEKDYPDPVYRGTWGVSDEDLFNRAHQEFSAATGPFFALVFTSSNHPPHEYPSGRITPIDGENRKVANAVRYADYALGRFFERARTSPYWDNTIFLVVADHDDVQPGTDLVPIEHFHIPGLILGGPIRRPDVVSRVASQVDLAPTLLSLMGIEVEHPMPGIDLLNPPAGVNGRAILQYGDIHALMRGGKVAVLQPSRPGIVFAYRNGHLVQAEEDNDLLRDAIATARWPSLAYKSIDYHPGQIQPHLVGTSAAHTHRKKT